MFEFFRVDIRKLLLIVIMLALPLISLNLERKETGQTRWYEQPIIWIVNPLQDLFTRFANNVTGTTGLYLNLLDIKKENRILKEDLSKLKSELNQKEELRLENERLKKLLEFQQRAPNSLLSAQVIAVDLMWGEYRSVQINKGIKHGLKKGMAVVTHEGVVGYLLNANKSFSTVLLLTDRNAVIDTLVQRTRARGIVEGLGQDLSQLKYLQRTDDVQNNDLVVTSGLDGVFPKGLPVGVVTKVVKQQFGVTQTVELSPVVNTSRLEEVFVVTKPESYLIKDETIQAEAGTPKKTESKTP